MARTASVKLSVREQTSIVSVLIVVPLNVIKKIGHQLARGAEFILSFACLRVPVIALTGLVVIAQYAGTLHHISQPVLVSDPSEFTQQPVADGGLGQ